MLYIRKLWTENIEYHTSFVFTPFIVKYMCPLKIAQLSVLLRSTKVIEKWRCYAHPFFIFIDQKSFIGFRFDYCYRLGKKEFTHWMRENDAFAVIEVEI